MPCQPLIECRCQAQYPSAIQSAIPLLHEQRRKALQMRSQWPRPQTSQFLGLGTKEVNHRCHFLLVRVNGSKTRKANNTRIMPSPQNENGVIPWASKKITPHTRHYLELGIKAIMPSTA
jgi:hypothetical protein